MSILTVENLSHSFGEKALYDKASFSLNKNDHMGVVGQNGVGKSTLLRILMGELTPERGEISWQNGARIGFIDQHSTIGPRTSIEEYLHSAFAALYEAEKRLTALYDAAAKGGDERVMARASKEQARLEASGFYTVGERVARVAAGLGIAALGMERALDTLSGGQRTKVMLAKLLLSQPDALLLDEPTNFLDTAHITWLSEYLAAFSGGFLVVSHDFDFLERVTNCICDIEFQTIRKYHGKYSDFVRQKQQRRRDYETAYAAQRRETQRLEDYIAKNKARASTARMAKSRQKQLDRMEKLPPPSVQAKPHVVFAAAPPVLRSVLEVAGLMVGYSHPLLPGLSFEVGAGEKIAITGFNGIGKSTLMKTLVGRLRPLGGRFMYAQQAKIGYFEQDLRWDDDSLTPLELLGGEYPTLTPKELRRALARCGVIAKHAMQPLVSLSGGEQNKVKLCRLTLTPSNFLALDEPTNHLDAETKESLREAIETFPGAALLVCHESSFLKSCTGRVIDIEKLLG